MSDVDRRLRELACDALFPEAPDVSDAVLRHIDAAPTAHGRLWRRSRRLTLSLTFATLAVTGTALAAAPGLRSVIEELLSLRGVRIHRAQQLPPTPPGPNLHLGNRVTRHQAAAAGFRVLEPHVRGLGKPDAVHLDATFPTPGGKVTLVWRPSVEHESGVGVLLTEFRASSLGYMDKTAVGATVVEAVHVRGDRGYWLAGAPHEQVYRGTDGTIYPDTLRLAGNTLVWEHGPLTLRLEGAHTKPQALRIARSLR